MAEDNAPSASGMSVVNLFVIGVKKAGTSWLCYLLDQHPDIFMPRVRELYFFGEQYPERLDDYHHHFPFDLSYKYFGEGSVTYFRREQIAREIKDYSPEAKILAIVRDPVERLLSEFRYHKQLGTLPEEAALCDALTDADFHLLEDSRYEQTLPVWQNLFGERFRVVSLEEATAAPEGFWFDLQAFLGVEAAPLSDLSTRPKNVTGSAAFRRLYRNTIYPIKQQCPALYEWMLESRFVRWAKQQLLHVLGTAQENTVPPTLQAELHRELAPTYAYLERLGFTAYQKPNRDMEGCMSSLSETRARVDTASTHIPAGVTL